MNPIILWALVHVALPLLRFMKVVWQVGHFLSGGVFLARPPIVRNRITTKKFRLTIESNVMNVPFDDVYGVPEEQDEEPGHQPGRRPSTSSTSASESPLPSAHSWMDAEYRERELFINRQPYFNVALTSTEEGQSYLYHG